MVSELETTPDLCGGNERPLGSERVVERGRRRYYKYDVEMSSIQGMSGWSVPSILGLILSGFLPGKRMGKSSDEIEDIRRG